MIPVAEPRTAEELYRHVKAIKRKMAESEAAARYELSQKALREKRREIEAEARKKAALEAAHERQKQLDKEAWDSAVAKAAEAVEAHIQRAVEAAIEAGNPLTAENLRAVLAPKMTPSKYLEQLCQESGWELLAILGQSRRQDLADARQMMIWKMRQKFPDLSMPQLGKLFGGRDHTTIYHALRKIEAIKGGRPWTAGSRRPKEAVIDFSQLRAVAADYRSFGGLP
jgi:chromosomal replication initiation ATPase DnaA